VARVQHIVGDVDVGTPPLGGDTAPCGNPKVEVAATRQCVQHLRLHPTWPIEYPTIWARVQGSLNFRDVFASPRMGRIGANYFTFESASFWSVFYHIFHSMLSGAYP